MLDSRVRNNKLVGQGCDSKGRGNERSEGKENKRLSSCSHHHQLDCEPWIDNPIPDSQLQNRNCVHGEVVPPKTNRRTPGLGAVLGIFIWVGQSKGQARTASALDAANLDQIIQCVLSLDKRSLLSAVQQSRVFVIFFDADSSTPSPAPPRVFPADQITIIIS